MSKQESVRSFEQNSCKNKKVKFHYVGWSVSAAWPDLVSVE